VDIQVPLLAAKALLLLLLFAFVYAVVRRGVGDLKKVSEEDLRSPGSARAVAASRNGQSAKSGGANVSETKLVVERSEVLEAKTRFTIKGGTTVLGRSPDSDIVLKKDDFASSRHARLTRHAGLMYVEDVRSTNGTYVNSQKIIGATPLRQGDELTVGSTTFRYSE